MFAFANFAIYFGKTRTGGLPALALNQAVDRWSGVPIEITALCHKALQIGRLIDSRLWLTWTLFHCTPVGDNAANVTAARHVRVQLEL